MSAFGSSLWNAYSTEGSNSIHDFVQQKLLGGTSLAIKTLSDLWTQQVFALISARVFLDPVTSSIYAIPLALNKHLRMTGWSEDPKIIRTTTISEPLVSDADATLLMGSGKAHTFGRMLSKPWEKSCQAGDEILSKLTKQEIQLPALRGVIPVYCILLMMPFNAFQELNFNHFAYSLEALPIDSTRNQNLFRMLLQKQEAL